MVTRIDDFISEIGAGGGMAMGSMFKVKLPDLTRFGGASGRKMEILCKSASLPNRQIITAEKRSGMELRLAGYGYTTGDVTLSFYLLNDYSAKIYFETWQNLVVNQQTQNIGYARDYTDDVVIQTIRKGMKKKLPASLALQSAVCTRLIARVGFILLILMPYHAWPGDRQSLSVASWFCRVLTGSKKQRSSFCEALPAHIT